MKIAVWDTYVPRRNEDQVMHFDILVPDGTPFLDVQRFGQAYLATKGHVGGDLTSSECQYCHSEAASQDVISAIESLGYAIIEMENC